MYAAIGNKCPDVIRTLIDAGPNLNIQDEVGKTVLMHAAANNENPAVLQALIDAGVYVNAQDNQEKPH